MERTGKLQKRESDIMRCFPFMKKFAFWAVALLPIAGAFMISGCGDDTLSGSGGLLMQYFSSTPSGEIKNGKTAIVEAKVTDVQGVNKSGQRVTFSVSPTSLGYFTPVSDTTKTDGTVASIFTATATGTVTLQATVGSASKSMSMVISDNATSTGRVTLEVTPLIMIANGADTAQLLISVVGADGQGVPNGTIIYLVAGEKFYDRDNDGYWTPGNDSLIVDANANGIWDPIGTIPSTVTTTNGSATATYRAGVQSTTAYVRASLLESGVAQYAEASVKLNPNTTVASISITHHFEDLRVKGVGGIEWTIVSATAYDQFGNTVPDGIPIDFTIANGPSGGENIESKGYGPVTAITNTNGEAVATVYSGTVSGTIRLRASSGSVISAVTQLVINAGPPELIRIGAGLCNVRSFDFVNVVNKVVAVVCDHYTNPVPDSTSVYFSTSEGCIQAYGLTGVANPKGVTSVDWVSCDHKNGRVWVYAETAGGTVRDSVLFISSGPSGYVRILKYPSTLVADGEDKGEVILEVADINNNFMVAGTNVDVKAKYGTIHGGSTTDGCYYSLFEVDYTSSILRRDYSWTSPDDGIGAVSNVSVKAGGVGGISSGFTTIFQTGNTYVKNSSVDIEGEVEPNSTVPFSVVVKDRSGNPLGGHVMTLVATMGIITGANYVTDEFGEINLFFTAPSNQGASVITVTDQDPRGMVSFAKKIKVKTADI